MLAWLKKWQEARARKKAVQNLFLNDALLPDLLDLCKAAAKGRGRPTTQLKHFLTMVIVAWWVGTREKDLRDGIKAITARTGIKAVVKMSPGSATVSLYDESLHLIVTERMVAK